MKTFDNADDTFVQLAADDSRRLKLIHETSRKRTVLFWCAVVITVCAAGMIFAEVNNKNHNSGAAGVEFFVAAMAWMQVLKMDSDLRLLKLVEQLKSSIR